VALHSIVYSSAISELMLIGRAVTDTVKVTIIGASPRLGMC
jgi:hypothetical protein